MITQETENIPLTGKWAKGSALDTYWVSESFYKSVTSGHESAGSGLCYTANDSLALFRIVFPV